MPSDAGMSRCSGVETSDYRKVAERLILWALVEGSCALSSLTIDDAIAYRSFPQVWSADMRVKRCDISGLSYG